MTKLVTSWSLLNTQNTLQRNSIEICPLFVTIAHCFFTAHQSLQTFAALPVDETTQQASQTQTAVQTELSVGSDRSGVIAKDLFKSLILSAVSLDDAVIDPWMQATRYGASRFCRGLLYF